MAILIGDLTVIFALGVLDLVTVIPIEPALFDELSLKDKHKTLISQYKNAYKPDPKKDQERLMLARLKSRDENKSMVSILY